MSDLEVIPIHDRRSKERDDAYRFVRNMFPAPISILALSSFPSRLVEPIIDKNIFNCNRIDFIQSSTFVSSLFYCLSQFQSYGVKRLM